MNLHLISKVSKLGSRTANQIDETLISLIFIMVGIVLKLYVPACTIEIGATNHKCS